MIWLPLLSLSILPSQEVRPAIVYDNTRNFQHRELPMRPQFGAASAEEGDEVWLAGKNREVVEIKLLFWNSQKAASKFDGCVSFRPIDAKTKEPGVPFFEGSKIVGMPMKWGLNEYRFKIPHIVVPDRFVWTVQVNYTHGYHDEFGPGFFDPPTVGRSDDFYWQKTGNSDWTPYAWGGQPVSNFGARILAVPAKPNRKKRDVPGG